jgi:hypothetical protein
MSWEFLPLKENDEFGMLVKGRQNPVPARFLTPAQAKSIARQNGAPK